MSLIITDKKFINSINELIVFFTHELNIDQEDMQKKFIGLFKVRDKKAVYASDFNHFIFYLDLTIKSLLEKNLAREVEEAYLCHVYIRNYLDSIYDIQYIGPFLSIEER